MTKPIIILLVVMALILSTWGEVTWSQEKKVFKLGTSPWIAWSPIHVAEAKGFWSEQGIEVNLVSFPSSIEITDAVSNELIDLGFDMLGTVAGLISENIDVVILAETNWSHGGDKIVAKKDLDYPALKGSPIGVFFDKPSILYFLNRYLAQKGVSVSDFRIVEMRTGAMADLFIADRLKVIVSFNPAASRAQTEGNGEIVATSATYEGCMPEGLIILRKNLERITAEDLGKILNGWVKAVKWCAEESNRKEFVEILNNSSFLGSSALSEEALLEMMRDVKIHSADVMLERNRDQGGLYDFLNDLREFLRTNGLLHKDFHPEDIFENDIIVSVLENR